MALSGSIVFTATGGASTISGVTSTGSGTVATQIEEAIATAVTNQLLTIAIDVSQITMMFLYADGALTVKTNSSGSPAQTFVFAANAPLLWATGMPNACPLSTDVTALYFTNASGATVTLRGVIVLNV